MMVGSGISNELVAQPQCYRSYSTVLESEGCSDRACTYKYGTAQRRSRPHQQTNKRNVSKLSLTILLESVRRTLFVRFFFSLGRSTENSSGTPKASLLSRPSRGNKQQSHPRSVHDGTQTKHQTSLERGKLHTYQL